jgi:lysophospholipase L1-like esterase
MKQNNTFQKTIIATLILSLFLASTGSAKKIISENDFKQGNIICFGNSLTEGVGASAEQSYPAILSQKLPFKVINAGKSGETTFGALARLEKDVLSQNPRLVIVEFGANDFFQNIPAKTVAKNLTTIINRIKTNNSLVILAGLNINWQFNQMYKSVAQKTKVLLIPDILENVFNNPDLMSDSLHPNNQGYYLVAQNVYRGFYSSLKKAGLSHIIPENF